MVVVRLGLVWKTKVTGLTRAYYISIRTIPRWTFWPPPWGLLINAAVSVRRRCVYRTDAYSSFPGYLGRVGDKNTSIVVLTNRV